MTFDQSNQNTKEILKKLAGSMRVNARDPTELNELLWKFKGFYPDIDPMTHLCDAMDNYLIEPNQKRDADGESWIDPHGEVISINSIKEIGSIAAEAYAKYHGGYYGFDSFTLGNDCLKLFNELPEKDQTKWKTIVGDICRENEE